MAVRVFFIGGLGLMVLGELALRLGKGRGRPLSTGEVELPRREALLGNSLLFVGSGLVLVALALEVLGGGV